MADKPVNIFTYLNQIYYKRNTHAYNHKLASSHLLSLGLSHDPTLIEIVNRVNESIFRLSPQAVYDYYFHKVPKGKRYIKWVKKDKAVSEKDGAIKDLMTNNDISKKEAMIYKNLV